MSSPPRRRAASSENSPVRQAKCQKLEMSAEQTEFQTLVSAYGDNQRTMQLYFRTSDQFLDEDEEGGKEAGLRKMEPEDIGKLSEVELAGLLSWIEKNKPYAKLPRADKAVLLKRYSVRKLSLDHFYSASKHPEYCSRREFVMNNNTFVPSNRTGFELPDEDDQQIEAKKDYLFRIFNRTFERFWNNVIDPFVRMSIHQVEVCFLHIMLLWSANSDEHVSEKTRQVMKQRRGWAKEQLAAWYQNHPTEPSRHEEMFKLLDEIDEICELHCQDFQVAKMYEFCDMSQFWYETLCYTPINTKKAEVDPKFLENLRQFSSSSTDKPANGSSHSTPISIDTSDPKPDPTEPNLAHIDRSLLAVNAHLLPKVMAKLPDDEFRMPPQS